MLDELVKALQWVFQPLRDSRAATRANIANAHRDVWIKLEEINVKLRSVSSGAEHNPEILALIHEANAFLLSKSLYLREEIHPLAAAYLKALNDWRAALFTEGPGDVQSQFMTTGAHGPTGLGRIDAAGDQVMALRKELLSRIRSAAGIDV